MTCQGEGAAFPEQQEGPYCWSLLCLMRLLQKGRRRWAQPCLMLTLVVLDQPALQLSAFWPVLSALLGSSLFGVLLYAVHRAQEQPCVSPQLRCVLVGLVWLWPGSLHSVLSLTGLSRAPEQQEELLLHPGQKRAVG